MREALLVVERQLSYTPSMRANVRLLMQVWGGIINS